MESANLDMLNKRSFNPLANVDCPPSLACDFLKSHTLYPICKELTVQSNPVKDFRSCKMSVDSNEVPPSMHSASRPRNDNVTERTRSARPWIAKIAHVALLETRHISFSSCYP